MSTWQDPVRFADVIPTAPAVYRICWKHKTKRFLTSDLHGILTIGKAQEGLKVRMDRFKRAFGHAARGEPKAKVHSEGTLQGILVYKGRLPKSILSALTIEFIAFDRCANPDSLKRALADREAEELRSYVLRHGQLPPLIISLRAAR